MENWKIIVKVLVYGEEKESYVGYDYDKLGKEIIPPGSVMDTPYFGLIYGAEMTEYPLRFQNYQRDNEHCCHNRQQEEDPLFNLFIKKHELVKCNGNR